MDLEEWEFIPGEGILNLREEEEGERNIIRYANWSSKSIVLDMNYFECPIAVQVKVDSQQEEAGQEEPAVSQVFYKKMKEPEFADITMRDSPKSPPTTAARGFVPASAAFDFDDNDNDGDENNDHNNNKKINLWKLGLTGFGAICSFGVATVCILFFGAQHRQKLHPNITFHIQTDGKKKKNMMKLNEAVSAIRGAHVTFGGYYEGSLIN